MDNISRSQKHKKNIDMESVFPEMESLLGAAEKKVLDDFDTPELPVFFIIGCARSGSTLLYQYFADSLIFSYPTNVLSRFYYSPYIGARIQQLLIDFDNKGEIFSKTDSAKFNSELGKTFGPTQPHEFWYFWDRFFKFDKLQQLSQESLKNIDWVTFKKELHAFESVYKKPILMKAMNMNWHLLDLKKHLPNIHFIYIKREVLYNAQSLLMARNEFFGNLNEWYSFKPANYSQIKIMPPEQQVVEQVKYTNEAIEQQLELLDRKDYTTVPYSHFCNNPLKYLSMVLDKCSMNEETGNIANTPFKNGNKKKLDDNYFNTLQKFI